MDNMYEIYEGILSGKVKRFPLGFWTNANSKNDGILLLRYIVKKINLTEQEIKEITVKQMVTDFKLRSLYRLYDNDLLKLLRESFPDLEFVEYYNRESFKKQHSEIIKNLSQDKWDRIKHGIRHNRYTPEYGEKLSKSKQGELNYIAKLKTPQVIEIRKKWETGNYSTESLGNLYGVKRQTVADIVYGRTWKHLLNN